MSAVAIVSPVASSESAQSTDLKDLTSNVAASLLRKGGPNAMPDSRTASRNKELEIK